jgi:hypothetical protein
LDLPHNTQRRISSIAASTDGSRLAWLEGRTLVVGNLREGTTRSYPLPEWADRLSIAPDGLSLVAVPLGWSSRGTPLQWVDLATGSVRVWNAPGSIEPGSLSEPYPERQIAWESGGPMFYAILNRQSVVRFSMASGAAEELAVLGPNGPTPAFAWAADFRQVAFWKSQCVKTRPPLFVGDPPFCVASEHELRILGWAPRRELEIGLVKTSGNASDVPATTLKFSPDGRFIAYASQGIGLIPVP